MAGRAKTTGMGRRAASGNPAGKASSAGAPDVQPSKMMQSLEATVDLVARDPDLTTRARVELLAKAAMTRKNILQGDKAEKEASGLGDDGPPGVVVVPVKVPIALWPSFAAAEVQAVREDT